MNRERKIKPNLCQIGHACAACPIKNECPLHVRMRTCKACPHVVLHTRTSTINLGNYAERRSLSDSTCWNGGNKWVIHMKPLEAFFVVNGQENLPN